MFVDSLRSRAVLVTGAGGGVGLALAGQLAAAGWTVIVHAGTAEAGDHQTNYLAPYLLTRMLAGPLNKGHGRIVSISSILHRGARLAWTDLTRTKAYSPLAAYGQATLALTMFTRALAKREPSEFTAISVDPGSADPDVVRMHRWATTPAEHSADIIAQLSSPGLTVRNGLFYEGLLPGTAAGSAEDPRAQARLWRMSDQLLGLD